MSPINILYIKCSPRREQSTSHSLGDNLLSRLTEQLGNRVSLVTRNLAEQLLPAVSPAYAESLLIPAELAQARFGEQLLHSDDLIKELQAANLVIIATPVHNFGLPAVLKNWIDHVVRNDVTFKSTETGKVGLLADRPVICAVTSGGAMFREPPIQPDFFRPYLRAVLEVIGIKDLHFVEATGMAFKTDSESFINSQIEVWEQENMARLISRLD